MKIIYYVPNLALPGVSDRMATVFRAFAMAELQEKFAGADITVACVARYMDRSTLEYRVEGCGVDICNMVGSHIADLWERFSWTLINIQQPARCKCPTCGQWSDV